MCEFTIGDMVMKKFVQVVVFLLLIVSLCGCASIQSALNVSAAGSTPTEGLVATPSPALETVVITEEMKQVVFDLLELNYKEYSDEELEQLKQSISAIKGPLSPAEIERLTQTNVQARIDVLTEEELDQLIMDFTQMNEDSLSIIKVDFKAYKDAETAKEEAELKAETTKKSAELKTEINQNINDFLNYEGEFTEEKVQEKIIRLDASHFEGKEKLGIIQEAGDVIEAQGVSMGCFDCKGDVISLIGFNDKDGERFVTPMITPTSFYESASCPQTFVVDTTIWLSWNTR